MESDSTISDRLLQYVQYLGIGLGSFAYNCKLSEKNLLNLKEGYSSTFRKISKQYPSLNIQWLRYGKGDMLGKPTVDTKHIKAPIIRNTPIKLAEKPKKAKIKTKRVVRSKPPTSKTSYPIRARLYVYIKHLGITSYRFMESLDLSVPGIVIDTIDKSAFANVICEVICEKYPELSYDWLFHGKGNMLNSPSKDTDSIALKVSQPIVSTITVEPIKQEENTAEEIISSATDNHSLVDSLSSVVHTKKSPKIKKTTSNGDWVNILKTITTGIGAIAGIFLVGWLIAEFVFPAIFIVLIGLSMLFSKK